MLENYVKKAETATTKGDLIKVLLEVVDLPERALHGYSNYPLEEIYPVVESVKAIVLSRIDLKGSPVMTKDRKIEARG